MAGEKAFLGFTGSLLWRGDTGGVGKTTEIRSDIGKTGDTSALWVFVQAIEDYSKCNLSHWFHVTSYTHIPSPPASGASMDKRAVLYFRHPGTLEVLNFQYPDPIADQIEDTPWGKRIKAPVVTAVVALLSTVAGIAYIPLYGIYYQRV